MRKKIKTRLKFWNTNPQLKKLAILILKIFFLGFNENKVTINNISEFDKSINYIKNNILCSKKPIIL